MATNMTKEMFLKEVFDFENKQEWEFQGELPCVIDFYADWCGPCKMMAPVIDDLAVEYAGRVNFFKINTEQEPALAGAFGIQSIPTLLFVPQNGKPQMVSGAMPKATLKKIVDEEILSAVN